MFKVGSMSDIDWTFQLAEQLAEQLDWHWRGQLRPQLDGTTDAKPVAR
jgi:hypothetical protein